MVNGGKWFEKAKGREREGRRRKKKTLLLLYEKGRVCVRVTVSMDGKSIKRFFSYLDVGATVGFGSSSLILLFCYIKKIYHHHRSLSSSRHRARSTLPRVRVVCVSA